MNVRITIVTGLALAAAAGLFPGSAQAERVRFQTTKQVRAGCQSSGGLYFPKTGAKSTYGCLNADGSGIVCGGITKSQQRSCDSFRKLPPHLPTRGEVAKAEAASKAAQ